MRKIGYKDRCEKKTLFECKEVCRAIRKTVGNGFTFSVSREP